MSGHASGDGVKSLSLEDAEKELIEFGNNCKGTKISVILYHYSLHPMYNSLKMKNKITQQMHFLEEEIMTEIYTGIVTYKMLFKRL